MLCHDKDARSGPGATEAAWRPDRELEAGDRFGYTAVTLISSDNANGGGNMRLVLCTTILLWGSGAARAETPATTAAEAVNDRRPNVLFLLSDDQRRDTIRMHANWHIHTPNLDRLVSEGTSFTRAYCMGSLQGAVCAPSRAMLLTGRTLFRATRRTPHKLLPEAFREAGYATFGTGKWHHSKESFARSFSDGGAIFFGGMSDHDKVPIHDHDPDGTYDAAPRRGGKFSSELFAEATIDFLRRHADGDPRKPFFAYVSFTAPHDPRTPPAEFAGMYDASKLPLPPNYLPTHPFDNGEMKIRDERLAPWPRTPEIVRAHLAAYYGMISHMDAQIGRILDVLEETGERDNTIIVFTSDHGLAVGSHGLLGKQNVYEHSMGTPLIIGGPGLPRRQKTDAFAYLFDLYPTLCELTDIDVPDSVEGTSLVGILRGTEQQVRDRVFTAYKVQRAIRTERWKLIRYTHSGKTQLFDLAVDGFERNNLADEPEQQERVARLLQLLAAEQRRLGDDTPLGDDVALPPGEAGSR